MKLLHKLFLPDALKLLGLSVLIQIALIIASSIFGVDYSNKIVFEHLAFFFLFFSHFLGYKPLPKNIIWLRNLPIKRMDLMKFNISYNIFILICWFFIWCALALFQIARQIALFPEMSWSKFFLGFSEAPGELLSALNSLLFGKGLNSFVYSSSMVMGLIFLLTFIFWMIVSIGSSRESLKSTIKYDLISLLPIKWKSSSEKSRGTVVLFLMAVLGIFLYQNYYFSISLFYSVVLPFFIGAVIFAHQQFYGFPLSYQRLGAVKYALVPIALCTLLLRGYSYSRITNESIDLSHKLDEIEFSNSFYSNILNKEFKDMLEGELTSKNIDFLMRIYSKKKGLDDYKMGKYDKVIFIEKVEGLDFKKVISSKKSERAILNSIGLFEINKLSLDEIEFVVNHLREAYANTIFFLRENRVQDFKPLIEILSYRDFNKVELERLISSHDSALQMLGLRMNWRFEDLEKMKARSYFEEREYSRIPKYDLTQTIYDNILNFNSKNVILAHLQINSLKCTDHSVVETLKMRLSNQDIGKAYKCNHNRTISSLKKKSFDKGYIYLNNKYYYRSHERLPFEEVKD